MFLTINPRTVPGKIVAVRHSVYTKHRLVLSVAEGYLTAADVQNHVQSLIADPDFEPRFDHLSDFTAVTDWHEFLYSPKRVGER